MLEHVAIGLAVVVSAVPASFAHGSPILEHCKSERTGIEAEERQTQQGSAGNTAAVSVEVPIGRVCVGPEFVGDEPVYVRRTSAGNGMTVVEVSTTPFMPVLGANERPPGVYKLNLRPDQPAPW
jgi:hypothetical protein